MGDVLLEPPEYSSATTKVVRAARARTVLKMADIFGLVGLGWLFGGKLELNGFAGLDA
jgi:hypothetical protein